jgi:hypothetical protein
MEAGGYLVGLGDRPSHFLSDVTEPDSTFEIESWFKKI